ncbi:MAG: PKD domain-containing protein [Candidatus Binataceae bacterium]
MNRASYVTRLLIVFFALSMLTPFTALSLLAQESPMASPSATPAPDLLPLTISIFAAPSFGTAPLSCGLFMNSPDMGDDPFVSYLWNFGDGTVSNLPPMTFFHTFAKPGTYVVTLTAVTQSGRMATALTGVVVRPPAQ